MNTKYGIGNKCIWIVTTTTTTATNTNTGVAGYYGGIEC